MRNVISSGIQGLDIALKGGFVKGNQILVVGDPGTGKTIIGAHFAREGIEEGENVVFITVEDSPDKLKNDLKTININLDKALFVDATPTEKSSSWYIRNEDEEEEKEEEEFAPISFEFNLDGLLGFIRNLNERKKIDRIVIDSLSTLMSFYKNEFSVRESTIKILNFLRSLGCTSLITAENHILQKPSSVATYLADVVITLSKEIHYRYLLIEKFKGKDFMRGLHTLEIADNMGAIVYPYFGSYINHEMRRQKNNSSNLYRTDRKKFGVDWLDQMLAGGLPVGSNTLISGPSGSGKTFLSLLFLMEGAKNQERGVFISLEDSKEKISRMMSQRGFKFKEYLEKTVDFIEFSPYEFDANKFGLLIVDLLKTKKYERLIIDGLTPIEIRASQEETNELLHALSKYIQATNTTSIFTEESSGIKSEIEITRQFLSYNFDNLIILRYADIKYKLRKYLNIIKMGNSNFDQRAKSYIISDKTLKLIEDDNEIKTI